MSGSSDERMASGTGLAFHTLAGKGPVFSGFVAFSSTDPWSADPSKSAGGSKCETLGPELTSVYAVWA